MRASPTADLSLVHGYTLRDLHNLARLAVHTVGQMGMDWNDRYDLAYGAIAEHLYSTDETPARHELVRVGQLAVHRAVSADRHHHGYYKHKTIGGAGGWGSSPKFMTFWTDSLTVRSCEHAVVERTALGQILPVLTARQQEAIGTLAALGNYRAAATALGIELQTFHALMSRARRVFLALWHEGEQPSRPWGTDRRVASYAKEAA